MTTTTINKPSKPVWLASFLLALFVDVKAVNMALARGFSGSSEEGGYLSILYLLVAVGLVGIFFWQQKKAYKVEFSRKGLLIAIYLLCYYYFTKYFIGKPDVKDNMFILMTVCSFMFVQMVHFDARVFIKWVMLLPCIAIFRADQIFRSTYDWSSSISMDVTYGFVIPIIAAIVYFVSYFKYEKGRINKLLTYVGFLCNSYFFARMLMHGSRGPLVCIILVAVFLFAFKWESYKVKQNGAKTKVIIICIVTLLLFGLPILSMISEVLASSNIKIDAIDKVLNLAAEGNVTNGRNRLADLTIEHIEQKPFFGWGLCRFDAVTNNVYPHNFILQILFDGGIFMFLVLLVPIFRSMVRRVKFCSRDQFYVLVFLFFASVPGALFSLNTWMNVVLWTCFGAFVNNHLVKTLNEKV